MTPANLKLLHGELTRDEGLRLEVYDDATGKPLRRGDALEGNPTVGVGRNLAGKGLSRNEARILLANDVQEFMRDLDINIPWWRDLSGGRQRALANMCFNMGWHRLSGFKRTLAALEAGDWETAATEAMDSTWARQVGDRAVRISKLILEG